MNYQRILSYVASTLWAIEPNKLSEILSILAFRASGQTFTAQEIEARIGGGKPTRSATRAGAVAVVPIHGMIAHRMRGMDYSSGGASVDAIRGMLRQASADSSVGTILLDVDSPGGTVPGMQELAAEIHEMRGKGQRIVAVADDLMASAAYWLASQADEVIATPSATVGSIGVFTAHQDLSKALELEGVKTTLISAGRFKVEGNPFESLSDEAHAVIQGRVDEAYAQFVADVARGRGVTAAAVKGGYGQGRAVSAKDALSAGLVDRIDTMDGTLSKLLSGVSVGGMRADAVSLVTVANHNIAGETLIFDAHVQAADVAVTDMEADRRRRLERF